MAATGKYAKGVAKRNEILQTALEVFSREGYRGASLREIAEAVNLSQAGLLHYFGSKEELFAEILRVRDESDGDAYAQSGSASDALVAIMRHNATVPGLVQLYATISAEAAEPTHPAHEFFARRYDVLRAKFVESVKNRQAAGSLDSTLDPAALASIMLAVADGLQVQWLIDPSIDMAANIEYLWSLIEKFGIGTAH
jgi:AcrR family transcriptional regulator